MCPEDVYLQGFREERNLPIVLFLSIDGHTSAAQQINMKELCIGTVSEC